MRALRTNVSYYRLRRELFTGLMNAITEPVNVGCEVEEEDFMVLRQFLSSKNNDINDDKRLSFDKSLTAVRAAALQAISRAEAGARRVAPGSAS